MQHEQVTYITDVITEVIDVPVTELPNLITDGKTLAVITIQDQDGKNPRRIAYDPSVEEHLVTPVNILKRELEEMTEQAMEQQEHATQWRRQAGHLSEWNRNLIVNALEATFWQRLKYAFTGNTLHFWGGLL